MSNGALIGKNEAKELIKNYIEANGENIKRAFRYDKNLIDEVLSDNPDCAGIRIYMGLKDDGDQCVVIVGVDANGKDLTENKILEFGVPCPEHCDNSSYFNE